MGECSVQRTTDPSGYYRFKNTLVQKILALIPTTIDDRAQYLSSIASML